MINKRMIKWAAVVAVLIATIVGSLKIFNHYTPTGRNQLLKRAIPKDAAFFIEVKNLKMLSIELETINYVSGVSEFPVIKKFKKYCSILKPLYEKNSGWQYALFQNNIIASFHSIGNNNFDMVLLLDFSNSGEPGFIKQLNEQHFIYNERNFRGESIYEVHFENGATLNFAFINKVSIISETASLTEDALSQLMGRNNLMEENSFSDIMNHVPDEFDLSFCFNYKNLAGFLSNYTMPEVQNYLSSFSDFGDWSVLDLNFNDSSIAVLGYSSSVQKANWLNQFDATTYLSHLQTSNIPDVAAVVLSASIGENSAYAKINSGLQSDPDFRRYIKPWIGNEIDFILTEPVSKNFSQQSFLVFQNVNSDKATEVLTQWATIKSGGSSAVITNYKSLTIIQLKINDLLKSFFRSEFITVANPFCCIYNQSVIMANSMGALKMYIDKLLEKNVLKPENFKTSSFSHSQYSVWFNPSRLKDFMIALAADENKVDIKQYYELIKKCNTVILPFTLKDNYFATLGSISFSEIEKFTDGYVWKTSLDTVAILAPQVMKDADDNKIIFIQDAFYQFYCINKGGEITWKRKLDSPVKGTVYQLDLYNNGEQQYVLNTNGGIYLFDVNGRDINNFPIRLAAPATSDLSMIDFDGKRQFKYFVSCSNGCIYGFEKSGKPLGGWSPNAGNGIIKSKLQFFKAGKSEFFTAIDANGKLLLFDRDGRKSSKEYKTTLSISVPLMLGKQNQLIAIDSTGKIYELGLDGKSNLFKLIDEEAIYSIMNIGIDTSIELNLLFNKKLMRIGIDTSEKISYNFESSHPTKLIVFKWPPTNSNLLLAVDESIEQLFLINSLGKLVSGFPKKGSSLSALTDLYENNEAVFLTVQNGNELIAYKIDVTGM